ncbi:MAG: hypothetical protein IT258_05150 [Saprospiraceae bacterium]|nr:hypothetical protein [Saprospiraceae bacterium]
MPQPTNSTSGTSYLDKGIDFMRQFVITLLMHRTAFDFIREHKPWRGIDRLGWVVWVMVVAGALLSYQFYKDFYQVVDEVRHSQTSLSASLAGAISAERFKWALEGSRKYLVMIVMELVVFYFIQKTLEIRMGRRPDFSTKAFVDAEIRIFKVTFIAWMLEVIARFLIVKLALGILGFDSLEKPVSFLIQCYFLGFSMVDNYHECFDLKVSDSEKRTRGVAIGVAVAIGLVAQVLMVIPGLGAVVATMLGGVAATLAMERFAPIGEAEHQAILAENSVKQRHKMRQNETLRER